VLVPNIQVMIFQFPRYDSCIAQCCSYTGSHALDTGRWVEVVDIFSPIVSLYSLVPFLLFFFRSFRQDEALDAASFHHCRVRRRHESARESFELDSWADCQHDQWSCEWASGLESVRCISVSRNSFRPTTNWRPTIRRPRQICRQLYTQWNIICKLLCRMSRVIKLT